MAGAAEHVRELLRVRCLEPPDLAHTVRHILAKQPGDQFLLRAVAGGQDDQIGGDLAPVLHACACGGETLDLEELLQRDGPVHDHVRGADIEVISATACEVFELPACPVLAKIMLEAACGQAIQERAVDLAGLAGEVLVRLTDQRDRRGLGDHIAVFQGRAGIVQRVRQLRRGLDVHDHRRAALDHRHLSTCRCQILADIVP